MYAGGSGLYFIVHVKFIVEPDVGEKSVQQTIDTNTAAANTNLYQNANLVHPECSPWELK